MLVRRLWKKAGGLGTCRFVSNLEVSSSADKVASGLRASSKESIGGCSSSASPQGLVLPVNNDRLVYGDYGEPQSVIRLERVTINEVKEGQVLVKMLAAPVNPADINTIQGAYPVKAKQLPAVPGNEGVGVVVSTDKNLGLRVGDWVIPTSAVLGSWQTYVLGLPADFIRIPSNIPVVSAATITINPTTAYRMLHDYHTLKPGDCVIQNGGNSAVGQAVIQLCREYGLKCVSLIRPRDDFKSVKAKLLSLGNSDTTVITEDDLRESMKGMRAQIGFNCVGGKSATEILRVLAPSSTLVTYGGMSRQPVTIPTSQLIFKDIRLKGFWIAKWYRENTIEKRKAMLDNITKLMQANKFASPEHKLLPLEKYTEALENTMKGYTGVKYIISFE